MPKLRGYSSRALLTFGGMTSPKYGRSPKQQPPLASERSADSGEGSDEDFDVAGFNLLHRAGVEVREFSEAFLRQSTSIPLAANVRTEHSDFFGLDGLPWHAAIRRGAGLFRQGAMRA